MPNPIHSLGELAVIFEREMHECARRSAVETETAAKAIFAGMASAYAEAARITRDSVLVTP